MKLALSAAAIAVVATLASATESIPCRGARFLGSYDLTSTSSSDRTSGPVVIGDTAYLVDGWNGLVILDISDPSSPSVLGTYDTPGFAQDVVVEGNTAYVDDESGGLQIIDVSNPAAPALLGAFPASPHVLSGIAESGGIVYAGSTSDELLVIDATNPASPTLIGSVSLFDLGMPNLAHQVILSGTYVYTGAPGDDTWSVIDVSNPAAPTLVATHQTSGPSSIMGVVGSTVYLEAFDSLGCNCHELQILDASTPASPVLLGSIQFPDFVPTGLAIEGTVAYVAGVDPYNPAGVYAIDVSNPSTPSVLFFLSDVSAKMAGTRRLSMVGSTAYLYNYTVDGHQQLLIMDLGGSPSSPVLGSFDSTGVGADLDIDGSTVYLAGSAAGLQILDATDPGAPVLLGTWAGATVANVDVVGTTAYICAPSQLFIVDVSNPAAPAQLAAYNSGFALTYAGATASGTTAYAMESGFFGTSFVVLDVSNPAAPTQIGAVPLTIAGGQTHVDGSLAYVANLADGLRIVDISTPSSPALLSTYATTGDAEDVAVSGTIAYVAAGTEVLILDVSNPASPSLLATYTDSLFDATSVAVAGSTLYVGDHNRGVFVLDVSTPSSPAFVGFYSLDPNYTSAIAVDGDTAYVSQEPLPPATTLLNDLVILDVSAGCANPCLADVTTQGAPIGDPNYGVPDGVVSAADLNYFVNAWVAGDLAIADVTTQGAPAGDPNYGVPDGQVTSADLNFYVNLWVIGCP